MISLRRPKEHKLAETLLNSLYSCLAKEADQIRYIRSVEFDSVVPILIDLLQYPKYWEKSEILGFVRRGIIETKRSEDENMDSFIERANAEASYLFDAHEHTYRMWTKVSIKTFSGAKLHFRIRDARVTISNLLPRRFRLNPYFINGIGRINPNEPPNGMFVTASSKFRSPVQAGHGLYRAMSDIVNLLNFAQHAHLYQIRFGRSRPKSNVLMSENQFLFKDYENLNKEQIWHSPQFRKEFWDSSNQSFNDIAQFAPWVRELIGIVSKSPLGDKVLSSVGMMVDGWSSNDVNYRLLRSWTAYEMLLSRSESRADSYEDIARRAIFMARGNKEILYLRIVHAAKSRHRYVHENADILAAEDVANGIEMYFSQIIQWIVFQKKPFTSHEQLINVLDLKADLSVLKSQIEDRARAVTILKT